MLTYETRHLQALVALRHDGVLYQPGDKFETGHVDARYLVRSRKADPVPDRNYTLDADRQHSVPAQSVAPRREPATAAAATPRRRAARRALDLNLPMDATVATMWPLPLDADADAKAALTAEPATAPAERIAPLPDHDADAPPPERSAGNTTGTAA